MTLDLIDKIKDIVNRGPDDWEARLQASVEMISPSGKSFSPKWRGNPRTKSKKLGIFSYPKLRGEVVQDLEMNSSRYPLTLYFEGKDHDLDSNSFYSATDENGVWTVTHPVHGFLELQLVSITEQTQPVTSGGLTVFDTEWIEPIDPDTLTTARELRSLTDEAIKDLNVSAAQQFADNVTQRAAQYTSTIQNTASNIEKVMDAATAPLFSSIDSLNALRNATNIALQSTITQATIITDSLAGQIQQLAQLPPLGVGSGPEKLNAFDNAIDSVSESLPLSRSLSVSADLESQKNAVATNEVALMGIVGAIAKVATVSTLTTRSQAVELAETIGDSFKKISDNLDAAQTAFEGETIDFQFFSQSQSFLDAQKAVTLATQYLQAIAPNLKIERRFVLEEPKTPIQIVLEQYQKLGDVEGGTELYDEFIDANELNDTDGTGILFLDRGTEVVTYA